MTFLISKTGIIAEVGTTTEQNGNNTNEVFEQNTTEHYGQDSTSEQNITKYYGENNTTELFGQGTVSVETVTEQSNNAVTITGVSVTTEETVAASATQTLIPGTCDVYVQSRNKDYRNYSKYWDR